MILGDKLRSAPLLSALLLNVSREALNEPTQHFRSFSAWSSSVTEIMRMLSSARKCGNVPVLR